MSTPIIIAVIASALLTAGVAMFVVAAMGGGDGKLALVGLTLLFAAIGLGMFGGPMLYHSNQLKTKRQAVIAKDRASIRIIQGAEQSYYRAHKQYTVSVGDLVAEGPAVARTIIDGQPAGLKLLPVNGLSGVNIQFGSYIYDEAYVEVPANFSIVLESGRQSSLTCVGEKKVCRGVEASK